MSWTTAALNIFTNPLVLLLALLTAAYAADQLFRAEGRLLPLMILAVAPPIGWISGYEFPAEIRSLGLVMFLYVIGLEAGTSFFPAFRDHWKRFVVVGAGAACAACGVAWGIGRALGWDSAHTAAFYAGAVTSTPAFEGLRESMRPEAIATFDLSYFMGVMWSVVGVLAIHFLWTRASGDRSCPVSFSVDEDSLAAPYYTSVHECTNRTLIGKPMQQTLLRGIPQCQAVRFRRDGEVHKVGERDVCREGDLIVLVSASPRLTDMGSVYVGPVVEITADDPLVVDLPVRFETVTVYSRDFIDRSMSLTEIEEEYGVEVRGWWRGREYMPARPYMRWRHGDRLRVLGTRESVRSFRYHTEEKARAQSEEIDLLRFSVGAVVAVFIGGIVLPIGPTVKLSLGVTGGALLTGLVFGRSARIQIPRGASFFIRELGLGLFLAGVGTSVGVRGPIAMGDLVMLPAALAVVGVPVIVTAALLRSAKFGGQYVEGGVCGAVTSTPALIVATRMNETTEPATTYAGIYLFALLASVAAAQVLELFG